MPSRLLVGNLDAEHHLAGEDISRAARATAAALATLLRVFAAEDRDRLWTPVPVEPDRVPALPGLPRPELVSGDWEDLEPAAEVLAWAEVPGVATLRSAAAKEVRPAPPGLPLHQLLWHIPPPDPEVAKRVLHRGFHLRVARELGLALPGARRIRTVEELEEHLEHGGAEASPTGGWVGKAPWSAAGRSRVIEPSGAGPMSSLSGALLSPSARRRVERLLARHGELLVEPWMDRVADFGCTGVVTGMGAEVDAATVRCHRLHVDPQGRFQGIELPAADDDHHGGRSPPRAGSGPRHRRFFPPLTGGRGTGLGEGGQGAEGRIADRPGAPPLHEAARRVAEALAGTGYRGPFGIDAYVHRNREGREALHPLGEINARLAFGHVARALAERLAPGRGLRLTIARRPPQDERGEPRPLLRPGEDGSLGAWVSFPPSDPVF